MEKSAGDGGDGLLLGQVDLNQPVKTAGSKHGPDIVRPGINDTRFGSSNIHYVRQGVREPRRRLWDSSALRNRCELPTHLLLTAFRKAKLQMSRAGFVCLVVVLLLTACGGDDEFRSVATMETGASPASTPHPEPTRKPTVSASQSPTLIHATVPPPAPTATQEPTLSDANMLTFTPTGTPEPTPTATPTPTPTVTITPSSAGASPFQVTFQFSEAVTGFAQGDITITGGSLFGFAAVDGDTYTVNVAKTNPTQDESVQIGVAANAAQDPAGQAGPASAASQSIVYNAPSAPSVSGFEREAAAGSKPDADALRWRVTFSEAVQNVDAADFTVSGTTATVRAVTQADATNQPLEWDVTVSGGNLASLTATVMLGFATSQNIEATAAGNTALVATLPPGAQPSYVVENTVPIEITPIGRGVSVTSENQILVELEPSDVVPANPFDLAGRALVFTPDGRGGYARAVRPLDWDPNDRGKRPETPVEIELKHFQFNFSGRKWRSFFLSRTGLITFGKAFPDWRTPERFGTMRMIADAMVVTPTISALYKPYLSGNVYVSDLPDRVVITFYAWDYELAVYGRRPKETFDYQIVLHSDGRVAFNYGPDPADPDEAFRDGIVGLFPTDLGTGAIASIRDPGADLSRPDSQFSALQSEVFRYPAIRDRGKGVADVSCRIIEVLGDEFDFFAFNSQFRVDQQEHGPAHGFGGYYWGNIQAEVAGIGIRGNNTTPCKSRLKNSWGFPVWMKARTVVNKAYANAGHHTPYDEGLTYFAHEIGHTWLAFASYLVNRQRTPMQPEDGGGHWAFGLHAPAPFPWDGAEDGSVMGGAFWRENPDGTFSPTVGWWTKAGGFSWLDLYLMGLATPQEVPDMFILRNLQQLTSDPEGPYAAEKEIITIRQVIAAIGPRNPPAERARKVFNIGFVYFLLPGQTPDPELLREHANYRDRALDHWRHVTGGRGQLTTELP